MTRTELLWFGLSVTALKYIRNVPGGNVSILGGHNVGHSKQNVYMYMCPIANGFRHRPI